MRRLLAIAWLPLLMISSLPVGAQTPDAATASNAMPAMAPNNLFIWGTTGESKALAVSLNYSLYTAWPSFAESLVITSDDGMRCCPAPLQQRVVGANRPAGSAFQGEIEFQAFAVGDHWIRLNYSGTFDTGDGLPVPRYLETYFLVSWDDQGTFFNRPSALQSNRLASPVQGLSDPQNPPPEITGEDTSGSPTASMAPSAMCAPITTRLRLTTEPQPTGEDKTFIPNEWKFGQPMEGMVVKLLNHGGDLISEGLTGPDGFVDFMNVFNPSNPCDYNWHLKMPMEYYDGPNRKFSVTCGDDEAYIFYSYEGDWSNAPHPSSGVYLHMWYDDVWAGAAHQFGQLGDAYRWLKADFGLEMNDVAVYYLYGHEMNWTSNLNEFSNGCHSSDMWMEGARPKGTNGQHDPGAPGSDNCGVFGDGPTLGIYSGAKRISISSKSYDLKNVQENWCDWSDAIEFHEYGHAVHHHFSKNNVRTGLVERSSGYPQGGETAIYEDTSGPFEEAFAEFFMFAYHNRAGSTAPPIIPAYGRELYNPDVRMDQSLRGIEECGGPLKTCSQIMALWDLYETLDRDMGQFLHTFEHTPNNSPEATRPLPGADSMLTFLANWEATQSVDPRAALRLHAGIAPKGDAAQWVDAPDNMPSGPSPLYLMVNEGTSHDGDLTWHPTNACGEMQPDAVDAYGFQASQGERIRTTTTTGSSVLVRLFAPDGTFANERAGAGTLEHFAAQTGTYRMAFVANSIQSDGLYTFQIVADHAITGTTVTSPTFAGGGAFAATSSSLAVAGQVYVNTDFTACWTIDGFGPYDETYVVMTNDTSGTLLAESPHVSGSPVRANNAQGSMHQLPPGPSCSRPT